MIPENGIPENSAIDVEETAFRLTCSSNDGSAVDDIKKTTDDPQSGSDMDEETQSLPLRGAHDSELSSLSLPVVARCVIKIGIAACRYGSSTSSVERFLRKLVQRCGFEGSVIVGNTEVFGSFYVPFNQSGEANEHVLAPITIIQPFQEGANLDKLHRLVTFCQIVLNDTTQLNDITIDNAIDELDAIPDPWGVVPSLLAWMATGGALPVVFHGSWPDVWVSTLGAGLSFWTMQIYGRYAPKHAQIWSNATCAFLSSVLAASVKIAVPRVNITISTLCSVAIPLPGYVISKGVYELATNHVIAGAAHFIQGVFVLLWLVCGGWLGVILVDSLADIPADDTDSSISELWLVLSIPILCITLAMAFQVNRLDFFWSVLMTATAYITTFLAGTFISEDFGTFLSTAITTVLANIWGRLFDRPNSIVLVPSIVLLVSGSSGFRGLYNLIGGEPNEGYEQLKQMIIVALLIVLGLFVGNTLVPEPSTL